MNIKDRFRTLPLQIAVDSGLLKNWACVTCGATVVQFDPGSMTKVTERFDHRVVHHEYHMKEGL